MTKIAAFALVLLMLACASPAPAQQSGKVWKIGVLVSSSAALNASRDEPLWQGLRERGYEEGKNLTVVYRYAEGKVERLPELAAELVRLNVDVIIAGGTRVASAAKQATSTIPIVVAGAGSLTEAGIVTSFTSPGGNVTGVSRVSPDFFGKRLELLKLSVPKAARLGAFMNSDNPGYEARLKELDLAVKASGMRLQPLAVRGANDFEGAFGAAAKERAEAIILMPDALFHSYPARMAELAAKHKLPAMYDRVDFVEAGGLMSYGPDLAELSRQSAYYVDRILQGAKPADLPMVEPIRSRFVVNLKAAGRIGLTVPQAVLNKADRIIK
jgi:putative ABC transport system substrate-binding protein